MAKKPHPLAIPSDSSKLIVDISTGEIPNDSPKAFSAEVNRLRATSLLADVSINTVTQLLVDVGSACEEYQDRALRNLKARRIQCDKLSPFVYARARNVPKEHAGERGYGDV